MKRFSQKIFDVFLTMGFPLMVAVGLWRISDLAPYGTPLNELSDHYWGILMDIARQWKTGEFSFWTRSIGGGFCLYSSGFYPVWAPFNIAAKFLTEDHFYLFKIVEPYFIGVASVSLLLRHGLKLRFPLVCFGALAYMGFVFTRHVAILHHPFFLWACAFFPLMIYAYTKLIKEHIYLRGMALGAFMSLVFLGGGAGQFAQMIIWGMVLLVFDAVFFVEGKSIFHRIILALSSWFIFLFFSLSIAAVQIIPTLGYTFLESIRTLGEYPVNNFPFFRNDYKGATSIFGILSKSVFFDGDQGVRAFWALMIFSCGKIMADWKMFFQWCRAHKAFLNVILATAVFFLLPPIAEILSGFSPFFARVFNPLRMITFGYCGFMIDMVLVLFLVGALGFDAFFEKENRGAQQGKTIILLSFFIIAEIYLFFPLWASRLFEQHQNFIVEVPFLQRYAVVIVMFLFGFSFQKGKVFRTMIVLVCLIYLGGLLLHTSYSWGEKGRKTSTLAYYFQTPEHVFFQKMKGRFYMPYVDPQGRVHQYDTMKHNYGLLFGVEGTGGYLNVAPKRFSNFLNAYHSQIYWTKNVPAYKYRLGQTPAALTTRFPVEFSTIQKGVFLPWPGFSKVVDGQKYDVWVSDEPVKKIRFAKEIRVVPFRDLMEAFDRPVDGIIYMTQEDADIYQPVGLASPPDLTRAGYKNFKVQRPDLLTFDVISTDDVFAVLPEIYQAGWQLRIDDKPARIFAADYIFIGFFLQKGEHKIELKYRPVFWNTGLVVSFVGAGLFLAVLWRYIKVKRKRL